jgi:hypothetical protein
LAGLYAAFLRVLTPIPVLSASTAAGRADQSSTSEQLLWCVLLSRCVLLVLSVQKAVTAGVSCNGAGMAANTSRISSSWLAIVGLDGFWLVLDSCRPPGALSVHAVIVFCCGAGVARAVYTFLRRTDNSRPCTVHVVPTHLDAITIYLVNCCFTDRVGHIDLRWQKTSSMGCCCCCCCC